jgi:hypothetical protein
MLQSREDEPPATHMIVIAFIILLSPWLLSAVTARALIRWDEARRGARSSVWAPSTRVIAVWLFGLLCLPIYAWRSRPATEGAVLGLALVPFVLVALGLLCLTAWVGLAAIG